MPYEWLHINVYTLTTTHTHHTLYHVHTHMPCKRTADKVAIYEKHIVGMRYSLLKRKAVPISWLSERWRKESPFYIHGTCSAKNTNFTLSIFLSFLAPLYLLRSFFYPLFPPSHCPFLSSSFTSSSSDNTGHRVFVKPFSGKVPPLEVVHSHDDVTGRFWLSVLLGAVSAPYPYKYVHTEHALTLGKGQQRMTSM